MECEQPQENLLIRQTPTILKLIAFVQSSLKRWASPFVVFNGLVFKSNGSMGIEYFTNLLNPIQKEGGMDSANSLQSQGYQCIH